MAEKEIKESIQQAISSFAKLDAATASEKLLNTLGYKSTKKANVNLDILKKRAAERKITGAEIFLADCVSAKLLFQYSDDEVKKQSSLFEVGYDDTMKSYLFFAVELKDNEYTRTQISNLTRFINRLYDIPVMLFFRYSNLLTVSVINRRLNKKDSDKDVLEKVTQIKDILVPKTENEKTHRAHIEILFDLSFDYLTFKHEFTNFEKLHEAWQKTLDTKLLNNKFFKELSNWYFWAQNYVEFPKGKKLTDKKNIQNNLIRLITRLIFVWFLKEKNLVGGNLFDKKKIKDLLKNFNANGEETKTYYNAILQNLFFATLNQKFNEREFVKDGDFEINRKEHGVKNKYRYASAFNISEKEVIALFKDVPFLNGGLFDCLDKDNEETGKHEYIDGFSREAKRTAKVPDLLFFGKDRNEDLSKGYGYKRTNEQCRGILEIFTDYKFTIEENTPIDEEIALDPELLGKVFENLLAYYNPETETPARKRTGSFYTPREIVNYMVDESLLEYLKQKCSAFPDIDNRLRNLFSYSKNPNPFDEKETKYLIDTINKCKILDPACGSGAFPMGVLHKMVHILQKLDKDNELWKALQRQKAIEETETAYKSDNKEEREKRLIEINDVFENNASDYGRKLYLIENCIYGVDIQPIAVQIAKLRFFISLVIDQEKKEGKENLGIRSLPNLETKFVAANTLIGLDKSVSSKMGEIGSGFIKNLKIEKKEKELKELRHKYFTAKTRKEKIQFQATDNKLRKEIAQFLVDDGWEKTTAEQIVKFDPYDQNTFASWFDPEWMFGLRNKPEFENKVQSIEVTLINKQIEAINKQIDAINLTLHLKHENEILKLQLVSTHLQISIIEIEVISIQKNINELYGSIDSKVTNIVKEPDDVSYTISALNKRITELNKKIKEINRELKPVVETATNGVFDIVIGNPPYIKEYTFKDAFEGVRTSPYYQGKMDLWYLFACKNLDYLRKKSGVLCFIATNNWTTNSGASKMRTKVLNDSTIHFLLDFSSYMIFESADIQTMVMLFRNDNSNDNYNFELRRLVGDRIVFDDVLDLVAKRQTEKTEFLIPKISKENLKDKSFTFSNDIFETILDKIKSKATFVLTENEVANGIHPHYDYISKATQKVLGDKFRVGQGIFVLSDNEKEDLGLNKKELELIKPYYTTEQIHKWYGNSENKEWIIYTDSKFKYAENIKPYPTVKKHLDRFQNVITSDNKPYGLHRAREEYFFKDEKIIVLRKCANEPMFTYTDFDCYVSATFYVIKSERINLKYLTSVLNSKLIAFWLKNKGKMQGNNYQLDKEPLLQIPIIYIKEVKTITNIVDKIISTKEKNVKADIKDLEKQIDALVYNLYDLTEEEIKVIENKK